MKLANIVDMAISQHKNQRSTVGDDSHHTPISSIVFDNRRKYKIGINRYSPKKNAGQPSIDLTADDIDTTDMPPDLKRVKQRLTEALMDTGISVDYRTVIDASHDPDVIEKIIDRHFGTSVDDPVTAKAYPFRGSHPNR